ncbi:MAG: hypothetical protein HY718_16875, partial [Planctomycetes bacterium]|nr:hypothetical protein [Planctomycetota bacterium]
VAPVSDFAAFMDVPVGFHWYDWHEIPFEQIGWIRPTIINEKENADFLRRVVKLRWALRRYFYAGQMERPPRLAGEIPKVTADWHWQGRWPVTTEAVLTGAWQLPQDRKLAMLFVNVSDQPVSASCRFRAATFGLAAGDFTAKRINPEDDGDSLSIQDGAEHDLRFEPRSAWAWEIQVL